LKLNNIILVLMLVHFYIR